MTTESTFEVIQRLLAPFNTKGVAIKNETSFALDLELDSLAVMDFVCEMEDHFDIMIPLNILPDLEAVSEVVEAVDKIVGENRG
jgi:acyl carrier protein